MKYWISLVAVLALASVIAVVSLFLQDIKDTHTAAIKVDTIYTGAGITVNFSTVEYFPNLKSKIGFASNAKDEILQAAVREIDDIGPGLMCANIEFDMWYKRPDEARDNAPIIQTVDATGRPQVTAADALKQFVEARNILAAAGAKEIT